MEPSVPKVLKSVSAIAQDRNSSPASLCPPSSTGQSPGCLRLFLGPANKGGKRELETRVFCLDQRSPHFHLESGTLVAPRAHQPQTATVVQSQDKSPLYASCPLKRKCTRFYKNTQSFGIYYEPTELQAPGSEYGVWTKCCLDVPGVGRQPGSYPLL